MRPDLQLWGGIECTLNRVGNEYFDQCHKSGHRQRTTDLELIAALGIKKMRYPCLWETLAPVDPKIYHWQWISTRLAEMQRLSIVPIIGLLHHGSGPCYTHLLDPEFPKKFAQYAHDFATHFPWVQDYIPINEILTTARFSCLYGHWYPHHQTDYSFLKAVFLQCQATVLAMREIRKVNPEARLIQTDDLGRCQSTAPLRYQRDFENERRWLAFDLLCGKFDQHHSLYSYALNSGIGEGEIQWFLENPFPPQVIGINHYHLSNRMLDHRMQLYPQWTHGGNGKDSYADVGAVDTGQVQPPRPESIFKETWQRQQIPLAITEVHMRGQREDQMRWFYQIWNCSLKLRSQGIPIEGVTAWGLFGSFDWHTLCTRNENFYEPGIFDLRSPHGGPRSTAYAHMIQEIIQTNHSHSPLLSATGTWNTPRRILYGAPQGSFSPINQGKGRLLLITGAGGTLGKAFARICGQRNIPYRSLHRQELDITRTDEIKQVFKGLHPWAVINAAGYVRVDDAEEDKERCFRENVWGPVNLANFCAERAIPFVTFSSDLVFDGRQDSVYYEEHQVSPLNVYGESKAMCEEKVLALYPSSLIIRTSSFFGPWDQANFLTQSLLQIRDQGKVLVMNDVKISPTYVPDLVHGTLDLLIDGETGVYHLTNRGELSWAEFVRYGVKSAAKILNLNSSLIIEKNQLDFGLRAQRPKNSSLASRRGHGLPPLEEAIHRYLDQWEFPQRCQP